MNLSPILFELTQLRYLDVAGNFIETIPTGEVDNHPGSECGSRSKVFVIFRHQTSEDLRILELRSEFRHGNPSRADRVRNDFKLIV